MFPLPLFYRITTVACGKSSISLGCGNRTVRPARSKVQNAATNKKKRNETKEERKKNRTNEMKVRSAPAFFFPHHLVFAPF